MAICSFFGHNDVYDPDIDNMLQSAVEKVVDENETVEFLVYQHGRFYNRCFLAALKARSRYPGKVTIAIVLHEEYFEGRGMYAWNKHSWIPFCMVDRIIIPPVDEFITDVAKRRDTTLSYKWMIRWLLPRSTHVISYLYRDLFGRENRLFDRAEAMPTLTIIDISCSETVQAIAERVWHIPDRERLVYQAISAGHECRHLAEQMGLNRTRVSQILSNGCRRIGEHLNWRDLKTLYTDKEKRSCSIFFADQITKDILKNFNAIIDFLIEVFEVRNFYIEASRSRSKLVTQIKRHLIPGRPLRILAVIDGAGSDTEDDAELEMENIMTRVCPPCDAAVCIDHADSSLAGPLGVIPDMIDLSDFCICDFSEIPPQVNLQKYITRSKGTILLDVNKACTEIERPNNLDG